MKYVILGKTGLEVSKICLGMMSFGTGKWQLTKEKAKSIIDRALELGINFFDTANVYSSGKSEEITGELLRDHRDDVVIATKVFFPVEGFAIKAKPNKSGLSRYHINRAINDSLERLGMDHVDLYQIHRLDPRLPMEEILRNMNKLIEDNKVLHIGASSMFAWQFTKFLWIADKLGLEPFKTMQNHYNLVYREEEREMLPLCKDQGIGVITWSPLARGFLTGKYKRGIEPDSIRAKTDHYIRKRYFKEEDFDVIEAVSELATEKEVTMAQIA
ncbi:MAG: aldo/keto reductase, partial [Candidatus Hodarchaeales archaeon]